MQTIIRKENHLNLTQIRSSDETQQPLGSENANLY